MVYIDLTEKHDYLNYINHFSDIKEEMEIEGDRLCDMLSGLNLDVYKPMIQVDLNNQIKQCIFDRIDYKWYCSVQLNDQPKKSVTGTILKHNLGKNIHDLYFTDKVKVKGTSQHTGYEQLYILYLDLVI